MFTFNFAGGWGGGALEEAEAPTRGRRGVRPRELGCMEVTTQSSKDDHPNGFQKQLPTWHKVLVTASGMVKVPDEASHATTGAVAKACVASLHPWGCISFVLPLTVSLVGKLLRTGVWPQCRSGLVPWKRKPSYPHTSQVNVGSAASIQDVVVGVVQELHTNLGGKDCIKGRVVLLWEVFLQTMKPLQSRSM